MSHFQTNDIKILNILNDQRRTGQFCDVIIKLNTGYSVACHFCVIACHFCVIASQSLFVGNKYFLQKDFHFSIKNPLEIEICNFDCEDCLSYVIDFMYGSQDVTIVGEHEEHVKLLIKILRIDDMHEFPIFGLEHDAANSEDKDMILKVENKQRRINHGFQLQPAQPAQSKKHSCNGCGFKCYRPSEMLIHINTCESDSKKCSLCDTAFETMTEFKGHLVRHDNDKPFFCKECDARFVTKTALNLHSPKHSTNSNLHICSICGKGFKWKHGLNSHLVVHSTEKKLLCDECGYSTNHLKTLRAHQLTHSGQTFRCTSNNCLYTSRRKENLKIHIATHRNETPFVCEVCGHRFSQNKNLKRHALLHLSKNIYKCPHCTFTSYRTDKLKEHILRLHTEKPLQLELSEDIQSALKDSDVDGVLLLNEPMKTAKVGTRRKRCKGKRNIQASAAVGSKTIFILPKPL